MEFNDYNVKSEEKERSQLGCGYSFIWSQQPRMK